MTIDFFLIIYKKLDIIQLNSMYVNKYINCQLYNIYLYNLNRILLSDEHTYRTTEFNIKYRIKHFLLITKANYS